MVSKDRSFFSMSNLSINLSRIHFSDEQAANQVTVIATTGIFLSPLASSHKSRSRPTRKNYCGVCKRSFVDRSALRQHDTDAHW